MQPQFNDNAIYHTTYEDYGKGWLVDGQKTFEQLREDAIKLEYLEKCYKSRRRGEIQKMENQLLLLFFFLLAYIHLLLL